MRVKTWLNIIIVNIVVILINLGFYFEFRETYMLFGVYFLCIALIGNIVIGYWNLEFKDDALVSGDEQK